MRLIKEKGRKYACEGSDTNKIAFTLSDLKVYIHSPCLTGAINKVYFPKIISVTVVCKLILINVLSLGYFSVKYIILSIDVGFTGNGSFLKKKVLNFFRTTSFDVYLLPLHQLLRNKFGKHISC